MAYRYGWSEEDKLDNLIPRIEGQAAEFVFSQLPTEILNDYYELKSELTRRYRVIETSRSFAAKFTRRNQRHGETAEEYAADLKRLYGKAYGHRDRRIRDEDLVRKFLDGLLDQDTKFEVEYHKEPKDIDEAVYHVVNLIQTKGGSRHDRQGRHSARRAYENQREDSRDRSNERSNYIGSSINRIPEQCEKSAKSHESTEKLDAMSQEDLLRKLLKRVEKLEEDKSNGNRERKSFKEIECFNCHEKGHYARACPNRGYRYNNREAIKVQRGNDKGQSLNFKGPALVPKGRSN
jgi:hypothetical protein